MAVEERRYVLKVFRGRTLMFEPDEWQQVWKSRTSEASILRGVYFLDYYKTIVVFKLETGEV
jgi:hypothetical protein